MVRLFTNLAIIPAPGYVGPGDIVSGAFSWTGLRAYSSASIGSNIIRLRRDSDNVEQDFVTLSLTGNLDVTSIATFQGGANLFAVKLYDQTGNGNDVVQATAGNQPPFTLNQFGTLPGLFQSPGKNLVSATTSSQAQPYSTAGVSQRTTSTGGTAGWAIGQRLIAYVGGPPSTAIEIFAGAPPFDFTGSFDGPLQSVIGVFNGSSSVVNVTGTETTGSTGSGAGNGTFFYGGDSFGNWFDSGYLQEAGWWPAAFSGGDRSSLTLNARTYWGF